MTDYDPRFACGCPWHYQRVGMYQYREVHTPECRERRRAHAHRYAQQLHGRYDHVNTVVVSAVPITLEGVPVDDGPNLRGIETVRPIAIPPPDVSLAAARLFESPKYPPAFELALFCTWWLRRQAGLLRDDES